MLNDIRAALGLDAGATTAELRDAFDRLIASELRKARTDKDPRGMLRELADARMVEKGLHFDKALEEVRREHRDLAELADEYYR